MCAQNLCLGERKTNLIVSLIGKKLICFACRFGKKGAGKKGFHKMTDASKKKFMNAIFGEKCYFEQQIIFLQFFTFQKFYSSSLY